MYLRQVIDVVYTIKGETQGASGISESYEEKRMLLTELKGLLEDYELQKEAKTEKEAKKKTLNERNGSM